MSKAHRGKGIRELPAHGRGTCASCKKENIKILFETEIDGEKYYIYSMLLDFTKYEYEIDVLSGQIISYDSVVNDYMRQVNDNAN